MRVIRPAPLALLGAVLLTSVAAAPPSAVPPAAPSVPAVAAGDPGAPANGSTPAEAARRAAALHQQALDAGAAGKWHRSARLHERAAALHAADDPGGTQCLEYAANLYYFAGERATARRMLEAAADRSLARGDVATAADMSLKAGLVARDLGDGPGAGALTRRARLLASSPHLGAGERADILGRIVPR